MLYVAYNKQISCIFADQNIYYQHHLCLGNYRYWFWLIGRGKICIWLDYKAVKTSIKLKASFHFIRNIRRIYVKIWYNCVNITYMIFEIKIMHRNLKNNFNAIILFVILINYKIQTNLVRVFSRNRTKSISRNKHDRLTGVLLYI